MLFRLLGKLGYRDKGGLFELWCVAAVALPLRRTSGIVWLVCGCKLVGSS